MTQTDLFLIAGVSIAAVLIALAVLLAVAGTRRREVARTVDQLLEDATPGQIDALLADVRADEEDT